MLIKVIHRLLQGYILYELNISFIFRMLTFLIFPVALAEWVRSGGMSGNKLRDGHQSEVSTYDIAGIPLLTELGIVLQ